MARRAGEMAEPSLADGDGEPWQLAARFDPLTHPVAITAPCVIGDQIRVPAAWCAMAGCEAAFADPAALGEADNRARAVAAGWAKDALCRLMCPACQRDRPAPAWWVPSRQPAVTGERRPASGTSRPTGAVHQPAGSAAAGRPPASVEGRRHRTQWPRLLSALVSSRDGGTRGAASPSPDAGTTRGQPRTPAPRQGQATHAAGSPGRRD